MAVAEINTVTGGSTGKIMMEIAGVARKTGKTVYTCSARIYRKDMEVSYPPIENHIYYGSKWGSFFHKTLGRLTGFNGYFSYFATKKLLKTLRQRGVDTIHLHNLHDFCIHLPSLFRFIKKNDIKVIWTLHDCWSFTGHCPYYTAARCDRWKSGCGSCPQKTVNPKSYIDTTHLMWNKKRRMFCGIKNMTIVTPSRWLAGEVKQSYLKDYPVKVINNGINLEVFKPTESGFRKKHGFEDKFILLGVASGWDPRKGLDVFIELQKRLDSSKYQIVLVGTDDSIDTKLPKGVLSIHRTADQQELAAIYTAADLLVNPTREDNYPTVNMEAIACGTPVLTYRTGGSPEMLDDSTGAVVPCDDLEQLIGEIERIKRESPYSPEACLEKAKGFDNRAKFREYAELYR